MKYSPDVDNVIVNLQLTRDEFIILVKMIDPFIQYHNEGLGEGIMDLVKVDNLLREMDTVPGSNIFDSIQSVLSKLDLIYPTLSCWGCGELHSNHVEAESD